MCRFEGPYPKWDLVFEGPYPKWDLVYAPMLLGGRAGGWFEGPYPKWDLVYAPMLLGGRAGGWFEGPYPKWDLVYAPMLLGGRAGGWFEGPYPKWDLVYAPMLLGGRAGGWFEGPYPKWDLVYAPMLLGGRAGVAGGCDAQQQMEEGVREMQLCTAALERAEKSKSETVANTLHELRTPLIGVIGMIEELLEAGLEEWQVVDLRDVRACAVETIELINRVLDLAKHDRGAARVATGRDNRPHQPSVLDPLTPTGMIEELLESSLEEWQCEDLRIARACAGETVELINRVLDLAKLQAGRLQLETLPCCLRRIVHEATSATSATSAVDEPIAPGKNLQVTCHVEESVPDVLMGDPTRVAQVIEELTAHAVSNATGGQVSFQVCCIPPPPAPHASRSRFYLPCASASADVSPVPPPPHASSHASHHLPSGSPAWRQLAACVRRFPPATHLARLPQRRVARSSGAEQAGGSSEASQESPLTQLSRFLQRLGASVMGGSGMGGSNGSSVGKEGEAGEEADGGSGHGRLEEEAREWVEGACGAREEGEWMVVMACEDSGGGIPPEELRWVLDPHGDSHHAAAAHSSHGISHADGGSDGDNEDGQSIKDSFFPLPFMRRGTRPASTAALTHEQRSAARPRWTPYPVRFLLSTALVAEMRGDMAVLSDAATGTTILLALPLGRGEDSDSCEDWGEDEESGGERDGCGSGSDGE
ncbi:unnamed protein product, partial [Closterium sp. Naga37s-1]